MTVPTVAAAPQEYDARYVQQLANMVRLLLIKTGTPQGGITMVDADTGEQKIVRVRTGSVVAEDP